MLGCGFAMIHIQDITSYAASLKEQEVASSNTSQINTVSAPEEDGIYTIVLDAGHGDYDTGGISEDGTYEKDITLSISLKLGAYLEDAGYCVVYTRTDDIVDTEDNLVDLQNRVDIAEAADADYFISLHTNFSEYNDGASGIESYINYDNTATYTLASYIHDELNTLGYTTDRGIKDTQETPLYVVAKNDVPAVLLELGFLSDQQDTAYLISENGQEDIAYSIAQGIMNYLPM